MKQHTKPSETRKSQNREGRSMYFNYVKNALKNNSVRELQDVAITRTSIDVLGNSRLQSDPYVMRGLQDLIPGRRTDVIISDGGKKVNMSLAQARNQLKKGNKKSPPKPMPISSEHTPPYSKFVSNVDNRAWRNGLSSKPMYPHQEARNTTVAAAVTAPDNGRKGPKEGTERILECVFELVFTGDKKDCGKGSCTASTQRSCLHICH